MADANGDWHDLNQQYLMRALKDVRSLLQRHVQSQAETGDVREEEYAATLEDGAALADSGDAPALERICEIFALSSFERKLLLLCAGPDLDGSFAYLCSEAQDDHRRGFPTFSLALAAFPDAHWSALTPSAPLRFWRLIEVGTGAPLTAAPLRIDERILHYLAGVSHPDERLTVMVDPPREGLQLVASHAGIAERITRGWVAASRGALLPAIQLCGSETSDMHDVATAACAEIGLRLHSITSASLPGDPKELDEFIRLWDREAALDGCALLVGCDDLSQEDAGFRQVMRVVERVRGVLLISSRDRICRVDRPLLSFDIKKPSRDEQQLLWEDGIGDVTRGGEQVRAVVSQFDLGSRAIQDAIEKDEALGVAAGDTYSRLWDTCRSITRPRLESLAQRIETAATWDELVLPAPQIEMLREVSIHVRQRARVYGDWGFGASSSRGLGISALFEGASGTGKTMAAEVLANELKLDLYRIDLSQVVSKYIGETEKNLGQVFDAAECGGAILLFDEADALFGKRSEINDGHDRYANIEVSYLLQRMESYRGLAILTTNMKSALDTAFLRRIRFVVQFPFPDASYRTEIWKRIFPQQTPTDGLDLDKLARLSVSGGNIRNIALNAAFLAAGDGGKVRMTHLLQAARGEYGKLEKQLSAAEISGWV